VSESERLRQFDVRTAPDRLSAWCAVLEQRIEALEADNAALRQRIARLEEVKRPAAKPPQTAAAAAIRSYMRRRGQSSFSEQRDSLQLAKPSSVAQTLADYGYGNFTIDEITAAMATWLEVQP